MYPLVRNAAWQHPFVFTMVPACDPAPKHMKNVQTKMLNLHLADSREIVQKLIWIINKHKVEIITDQLFGLIVVLLLELRSYVWRFQHSNYL